MVAAREAFAEAWDVLKMGGNQQTAMMHDLPAYMEEALNQKKKTRNDARKKKTKASKLREMISDHEEDADVMRYYKENHPEWFNSVMKYEPRAGTDKPGMVIMIGVKGKKKDNKKKYGSAPMMKAWEQLVEVTYLGSYEIEES